MSYILDLNRKTTSTECIKTPLGNASVISCDAFLQHVAPPVPSRIDLDAFIRRLRRLKGPAVQVLTKNGHLWGYNKRVPSQMERRRAFSYLHVCIQRLAKRLPEFTLTCSFENNDEFLEADPAGDDALPEAYLCLPRSETAPLHDWSRVAVPGSYQQRASPYARERNAARVARCMSQCMRRDPRRRFTYGFTVDDTEMRLWFCDRSQMIVSTAFNFISNFRALLHFFLGCMLAEPHMLGFDPSMTPIRAEDGSIQYDITFHSEIGESQVYRTIRPLFDGGADLLFGRGTRVWEAIRLDGSGRTVGEPVALKDSWVDGHREREGDISSRIRHSSLSLDDEDDRIRLNEMLLTVVHHGDVYIAGALDSTRQLINSDRYGNSMGAGTAIASDGNEDVEGQVHYRIVYAEIGRPLREETSLRAIYEALVDACAGLYALHRCGWIHGDISSNNIFLYRGKVKLADLEYAKKKGEIGEHDRIGTQFFLPVEVAGHGYVFQSAETYREMVAELENADVDDEAPSCPGSQPTGRRTSPGSSRSSSPFNPIYSMRFRYGPMHDLESLWWMSVYFAVARSVVDDGTGRVYTEEEKAKQRELQLEAISRLFYESGVRIDVMSRNGPFVEELRSLHPAVSCFWEPLEMSRMSLSLAFRYVEQDIDAREFDPPLSVYNGLRQAWFAIAQHLRVQDITVKPLSQE